MITVLLEKIITILEGWIQSFTSHAQHVEDKLDSLDHTASDIETNTDPISDIADNTGAVVTPIQNIKSNTDSIKQSSQTSANNSTAILNNVSTLSTNTGRAAAFAEDCANNTLDIKDKVTTIASDTTQIRADNANIAADVSSINQAIGYYVANTPVTEDSEGDICNFDTDLEDYLQKYVCIIPSDINGFSSVNIIKTGKNLSVIKESGRTNNGVTYVINSDSTITITGTASAASYAFSVITDTNKMFYLKKGIYTLSGGISANIQLYIGGKYVDGNSITQASLLSGSIYDRGSGTTFELPKDCFAYLQVNVSNGTSTNITIYPQLEFGSNKSAFEIHKETYNSVSFGSTITDGAEIDLLSGLVKVNTTPASFIQIPPIAIRTYKGVNNIYSDIGTSALTYRETLKHYLDKNNQ